MTTAKIICLSTARLERQKRLPVKGVVRSFMRVSVPVSESSYYLMGVELDEHKGHMPSYLISQNALQNSNLPNRSLKNGLSVCFYLQVSAEKMADNDEMIFEHMPHVSRIWTP